MSRHFWKSFFFHAVLFGAIAFFVSTDGGKVRGSAGLSGSTQTRLAMVVAAEISAPPPREKKIAPVREGLAVKRPLELPRELKRPEKSDGTSETAEAGKTGQGGTGTTAAEEVGNADRTNRLGLYLQRLERKIQSNLGASPYLEFNRRARLSLTIRQDGSGEVKLIQTSGDRELDRRALLAAERSRPFEPWEENITVEVPVLFLAR